MAVLAQQKSSQREYNPYVWIHGGSEGGETRDMRGSKANASKLAMKKFKLQVKYLFLNTDPPCARLSKFKQKMPSLRYSSYIVISNCTVIDNPNCYFRNLKSL